MPTALICEAERGSLEAELQTTLLWRREFERTFAGSLDEALTLAAAQPDVVVVDRDADWAVRLIRSLRSDGATRALSIVVVARGDFDVIEIELLEAGSNAVLRMPPGREWDKRLTRLLQVAVRRQARFTVHFRVDTTLAAVTEALPAVALNLSETGMLVESADLQVGAELHVAFQLPGQPGLISGRARVVRQAGPGRFGVEFSDLEGAFLEQIRSVVLSLKA
jgi:DNA-binding response OmpR family regulator